MFKILGQFVAKALFDGRITDLALSRTFMKLVLEHEVPLTIAAVKVCTNLDLTNEWALADAVCYS
jgi:hypothetical protein